MKRREFITLIGGAAATWPIGARAQQPAMPVIGYLYAGTPELTANRLTAFRKGLSEVGYVEGHNMAIEYRWGHNQEDRLPELAADLVRRRVAVIATPGSVPAALAAKSATTAIPVVFMIGADQVQTGLVASLNRPEGNVTGVGGMNLEISAKRLGLLHELLPEATRIAALVSRSSPVTEAMIAELHAAAAAIARQIDVQSVGSNNEIDAAFATFVQKRVDGLLVGTGPVLYNRRVQLATLAARYAVPAIYPERDYAEAGGLMSYGPSNTDQYRLAGIYTGRILKGDKPADLPVLRPTKFEFVISVHTAKMLGIDVPATLLARADEVIE